MRIAIHHQEGSFSERWISYCKKAGIDYKIVNCYTNDIINQLNDCDAFMWHHHHENFKDVLFAKQLIFSIEQTGKKVFPDFRTCWHFDDKIGQKYIFELIDAPLVPSYVFYSKKEALEWAKHASFPKVFKLRRGAGSENVKIVRNVSQAKSLIGKSFGRGFLQNNQIGNFKERYNKYRNGKDTFLGVMKGLYRLFVKTEFSKLQPREKGYIYFQDFIPGNSFDIRVIVIGDRAFAIKRLVRKNDFRASGSGDIVYERDNFPVETIKLAFDLTQKLRVQCVGYDFIYDSNKQPKVVEMSYGFSIPPYDECVGYWDQSLEFHEGTFIPQEWMVDALL